MASLDDDPLDQLPQTTRSGIKYEIESLSVRRNRVPRASQTIVKVRINFTDCDRFIQDMVGRSYMATTSSTSRLRRDLPEQNPQDKREWCVRCEQIDQGGGESPDQGPDADELTGWPVPKWAKFQCVFEAQPFDLQTDQFVDDNAALDERELFRYIVRSRRPHSKEQQFPGGAFYIVGGGTANPLMQTGFKIVVFADVQYTWYRVPVANLPLPSLDAALGHFNNNGWDLAAESAYGWDEGTLLFIGYDDTDKYWDANGDWVCDLVLSFQYKQGGWNFFLNNKGAFVEVSDTGTSGGNQPYTGVDFNTLVRGKA